MLKLYDSLTRKKRAFKPLKSGQVTMYNCGPTVYDNVHIGNLRAFLLADLLRRTLDAAGQKVTQVMNITDVGHMLADADEGEDKLEVAAAKSGDTPQAIAARYTQAFFRDIERLGIRKATVYPKASEHVPEMIALIEKLLQNGHAYQVETKNAAGESGISVYFDVASFPEYGKLSGNRIEGLEAGHRIAVRNEKKHPADFALWIWNPKHLQQWTAPWGQGYPGWHVECSAMAGKYLGPTVDIHTGGEDNRFPHHECEIAQSECANEEPFARYWLHVTHLMVEGEKMSKSKGNFYVLDDLVEKGFAPRDVRYLLLSTHYRQPLNFTLNGLTAAKGALSRLDNLIDALRQATFKSGGSDAHDAKAASHDFQKAIEDDLNVPEALASVFEYVTRANERLTAGALGRKEKDAALALLDRVGDMLGFSFGNAADEKEIPESVMMLIEARDRARTEKRFAESDRLRDELKAKGYLVEDTADGRRIKRI